MFDLSSNLGLQGNEMEPVYITFDLDLYRIYNGCNFPIYSSITSASSKTDSYSIHITSSVVRFFLFLTLEWD